MIKKNKKKCRDLKFEIPFLFKSELEFTASPKKRNQMQEK